MNSSTSASGVEQPNSQVVERSNEPDYSSVTVPTKPPTEFNYVERRADLLQQVQNVGHPAALNQTELADRYGVSQQQISKDFDRLDEFIRERLSHRRDLKIGSAFDRALRGLLEEGEWYEAAKVAQMLDDYLDSRISTVEFRKRLDRLEHLADREGSR